MNRRTFFVATLVAGTGAALAPAGDCGWQLGNISIGFVPDFDQIRPGFLNDGYQFCVPTTYANWLAWIDDHGDPDAVPYGPQNWQSQTAFNGVSAMIAELGGYMDTDSGGTSGEDAIDGFETWLDTYTDPDAYQYGRVGIDDDYVPSLDLMWTGVHQGALIIPVFGWYKYEPYIEDTFAWYRNSGHVVNLNGLFCNNQNELDNGAELWFRDPADDVYENDLPNQSQFFTRQHTVTSVTALFSLKSTPQPGHVWPRTQFRVNNYAEYYAPFLPDTKAFYEGFLWIRPTGGYSVGVGGFGLATHDPNQLDYLTTPPTQTHPLLAQHIIADLTIDPLTREHVLLARQTNGQPDPAVRSYNSATFDVRTIYTAVAPRRAMFDRFGNLYLLDENRVVRVDKPGVYEGTGQPDSAFSFPPAPMDALAWDSRGDVLYAYSGQLGVLARYPRGESAQDWAAQTPMIIPVPGDLPQGEVHMTVDPTDGCVWMTGVDSRAIVKYAINPTTGTATVVESFMDIDLLGATGLDVSRGGRVFVVKNGAVVEYSQDGGGAWGQSTQTAFAGLAAHGLFRLDRGSSNMDPDPDDTMDTFPPIALCPADLNGDGAIDGADLALLLGAWGPCAGCPADFNDDGVINGADLAILLGAWGPCA